MKRKFLLTIMLFCLLCSITACGQKEIIESTEDFEEIEQTEEHTEDEFAINDKNVPGYEVRETKATKETQKQLSQEEMESIAIEEQESIVEKQKEIDKKKAEALGQEYKETEPYEEVYIIDSSGEEVWIEDIGEGLVGSMREQVWSGLIDENGMSTIDFFIDENFPDESSETKKAIKAYIEKQWEDYNVKLESIAALPPEETWSEKELEENPDLYWFSRSEMEYLDSINNATLESFPVQEGHGF